MPEEKVIEGSLQQSHGGSLRKYVLFLAIIFAVLWAINSYYTSGAPKENVMENLSPNTIPAPSDAINQERAQAERVSDVFTYNEAISKKDKTLCERIIDESLKSDCFRVFRINGL